MKIEGSRKPDRGVSQFESGEKFFGHEITSSGLRQLVNSLVINGLKMQSFSQRQRHWSATEETRQKVAKCPLDVNSNDVQYVRCASIAQKAARESHNLKVVSPVITRGKVVCILL